MRNRNFILSGLLFYASLLFLKTTRVLPLRAARALGIFLADIAYWLVPRIRKVGMDNLDIAYGDAINAQEKRKILRGSVRNLGLVAAEFSRMPLLASDRADRHATVRGLEHVNLAEGAILMGAHSGNWEWMISVGVRLGFRMAVIVREFDDPRTNAVIDEIRRQSGVKTVSKNAAMGPLLSKIRNGCQVGVLADQCPRENAAPATFFGIPTWATIGPALLSMRARVPLHPVAMIRNPDRTYTLEFQPAVPFVLTGNFLMDLQENTQRCQNALEELIRRHPDQWLWFHRRWKKRERLEQEWQSRLVRHQRENSSGAGAQASDQPLQEEQ